MLVLKGLVGLHRTIQLQLLQHFWLDLLAVQGTLKSLLQHHSSKASIGSSQIEMAGMNIDILGISELKWIRMNKFNIDGRYIYYCGQESLRRNGIALIVNKRV